MSRETAVTTCFISLLLVALALYQPVKVAVYECSEHPEFQTRGGK